MADPLSMAVSALLGGGAVAAVASFIKSKGKAIEKHGEAERVEAQADATIAEALADALKRAEARAEAERTRADSASAEAKNAREETGQHVAVAERTKRTYEERLSTMERLVVLQGAELEQCNKHRAECDEKVQSLERRVDARITRLSPPGGWDPKP